jgi:hypothetical protein
MSAPSGGSREKSVLQQVVGRLIFIGLLIIAGSVAAWYFLPDDWATRMRLEKDVIWKRNLDNDAQMARDLTRARRTDKHKKEFTMADIDSDRMAIIPSAQRAYYIKQIRKEYDDESNGRNEPGQVVIAGNSTNWVPTGFAIGDRCKLITAQGEIVKDSVTKSGPDGVSDEVLEHPDYKRAHGDKITLLNGVRWGTLGGMVCEHPSEMQNCTPAFVLGSNIYLNADVAGREGYLWAIDNRFVPKQTTAGLLTGRPINDLSDNNLVRGEYRMNQEMISSDRCHR